MKYLLPAVSIIILVVIVAAAAFFLGQKSTNPQNTNNPAQQTTVNTQISPVLSPTPTTAAEQNTTVSAGGVLVFNAYTLSLPSGWTSSREQGQDMDRLTLTKLGYKLVLYQAAFGGGGCVYPGDQPSDFAQKYVSFTEVNNPNGFVFRRGQNESSPNTYTYCQKNTSDGSFGSPTSFGAVSLTTAGTPDKNAEVFPEADSIIASLKKQ